MIVTAVLRIIVFLFPTVIMFPAAIAGCAVFPTLLSLRYRMNYDVQICLPSPKQTISLWALPQSNHKKRHTLFFLTFILSKIVSYTPPLGFLNTL